MKPINYLQKNLNKFLIILSILIVTSTLFVFGYKQYLFIELITFNKVVGLPAKMALFTSKAEHISILYPATWDAMDTPTGEKGDYEVIAVITNFVFSPFIEISRLQLESKDIGSVVNWGRSRAENQSGYRKILIQPYTTHNNSGVLLEYARNARNGWGEFTDHCIDWFISKADSGYDFSFCINQKNWKDGQPIFYQMIDSIRFMNSQ